MFTGTNVRSYSRPYMGSITLNPDKRRSPMEFLQSEEVSFTLKLFNLGANLSQKIMPLIMFPSALTFFFKGLKMLHQKGVPTEALGASYINIGQGLLRATTSSSILHIITLVAEKASDLIDQWKEKVDPLKPLDLFRN